MNAKEIGTCVNKTGRYQPYDAMSHDSIAASGSEM